MVIILTTKSDDSNSHDNYNITIIVATGIMVIVAIFMQFPHKNQEAAKRVVSRQFCHHGRFKSKTESGFSALRPV